MADRERSKAAQFSWGASEAEKLTSQTCGLLHIKSTFLNILKILVFGHYCKLMRNSYAL